jgi:hypothetical protein
MDEIVINDWLKLQGNVPLTDKPIFRLVWSTDQTELRIGTFGIFDHLGRLISSKKRIERVKKYSWLIDCWVLEQWFPPEAVLNEELPESCFGSYEPIYVFETNEGKKLPLNLRVVQLIINVQCRPKTSEQLKKSLIQEELDQREKAAADQDWEILNDEGPLVSQFHDGTAILNPKEPS